MILSSFGISFPLILFHSFSKDLKGRISKDWNAETAEMIIENLNSIN